MKKPARTRGIPAPSAIEQCPARTSQDRRTAIWWWKPSQDLRPHFTAQRLGPQQAAAWRLARTLNDQVDNWQKVEAERGKRPKRERPRGPATVGQIIGRFRTWIEAEGLAPRTLAQYGYELQRLEAEFGHEVAATLAPVRVDDWADTLRRSAPETLRHVAARGRQVFEFAMRKQIIPPGYNPFAKMRTGSGQRRKLYAHWADVKHLIATADKAGTPSLGTAFLLSFVCVQRITDVVTFTHTNIAGGRLRLVQSKTGVAIDATLPDVALQRLKDAPPLPSPQGHLLVSEQTLAPWHEKTISRAWARLVAQAIAADPAKWAHLAGLQLRDGRRSGFTHLLDAGRKIEDICSISGHTIEEGMQIVEHYAPRTARRADRAMLGMKVKL